MARGQIDRRGDATCKLTAGYAAVTVARLEKPAAASGGITAELSGDS